MSQNNKITTVLGGVEGGATHTVLMLFDQDMNCLAEVTGPSSNVFQIGMEKLTQVIHTLAKEAFTKANLPSNTKLKSLGLSLSGCEREETNREVVELFKKNFPGLSETYVVKSDTVGPLATASSKGGLVLIAGTGSNALLLNPDGTTSRCGGWGHLIGDEGSACWVALKAVKIYFDHLDNKVKAPFDVEGVGKAIMEHFQISDRFDLLVHLYEKWDKSFFANLCKKLADAAEKGDELCKYLFEEAGKEMAQHLIAILPDISDELLNYSGGLPVLCIGSVWKSWKFMEPGFVRELKPKTDGKIKEIQLFTLRVPVAIGACYLGADGAGFDVPKKYAENTNTFFHSKF